MKFSSFVRALLLAGWLAIPLSATAASMDDMTAQEQYDRGVKMGKRGYYMKALELLNHVRNYHRDDPISVQAELAIADVYFRKGEYEQARLAYEDFARLHPRHAQMDWVTFRTGLCLYKRSPSAVGRDQTPTRQAVNTWTGFATRYPDSEYIADVDTLYAKARDRLVDKELAIAHFYEGRKAWTAVRRRAEGVIAKYPDSARIPAALFLDGKAAHAWGDLSTATAAREQLAADHPDSKYLARLDRVLARPAGTPPEEDVFLRPYRTSGGAAPTAGGPPSR